MNPEPDDQPTPSPDDATYEEAVPALDDPRLVECLESYLAVLAAGGRPDRAAVLAEHPAVAAELAACLDVLELVQDVAAQLDEETRSMDLAIEAMKNSAVAQSIGTAREWFFIAMAHWHLGQKQEAHQWYDQAVAIQENSAPDDAELRRLRAWAARLLELVDPTKPGNSVST